MAIKLGRQILQTFGMLTMFIALTVHTLHAQVGGAKSSAARRLTVTGQGKAQVKPDMVELRIAMVTENPSSPEAKRANGEASQRIREAVKGAGVADRDIRTLYYSVEPQSAGFSPEGKPEVKNYRVYHQIQVTVRDLSRFDSVLDIVTKTGSNTIENIQFGLQDLALSQDLALEKAIRDAKRKADRMAMTMGARVVGVYEANEGKMISTPPIVTTMRGGFSIQEVPPPFSHPGELNFYANVTIVYEIEKAVRNAKADTPRRTARKMSQIRSLDVLR